LSFGVVLVGLLGELLRRIRLERVSPAERYGPASGAMHRWVREGRGATEHPPA
jgi:hypothetical protein